MIAKNEGGPPAREGSEVIGQTGEHMGNVTSGNFAPMLNRNIAMAYLTSQLLRKQGESVFCTVRGKKIEYQIAKMPFVKTNYYI